MEREEGGGGRDLWELLIQGAANAHIHEDLELPLRLQRSELCFPLRMPSSTRNTVRSLFLSSPSLTSSPPPPPPFPKLRRRRRHPRLIPALRICTPPNPFAPFFRRIGQRVPFYLFICFSHLFFSPSSPSSNPHPLFSPQARRLASPCLDPDRLPRSNCSVACFSLLWLLLWRFFFLLSFSLLRKCAASVL